MLKFKILKNEINKKKKNKIIKGIDCVINKSWGSFGEDYVEKHILTSDYVVVAISKDEIVGFSSARKYIYKNRALYYLEFTAILPCFQGKGLSKKLNMIIFKRILLSCIKNLNFNFEVVTISPNPKILGTISRSADFVFPNPYVENKSSTEIKSITKFVLDKIGDPFNFYNFDLNVIEGFYDDMEYLIYEPSNVPTDKDAIVNKFAKKFLRYEDMKGREFVIYARYSLLGIIKHYLGI